MYPDSNSRSAALYEEALQVMPGGNTRTTMHMRPYPIYIRSGKGARVTDADGVERLDFINAATVLVHGYGHPPTIKAVTEQLQKGTLFYFSTESEIRLAQLLCERVPSFERIRFVSSGTEAVMTAMKAARAYTGRRKIAKCEGAYHGTYDYAEISLSSSPENWGEYLPASIAHAQGTPESVLEDMVIIPFNDTAQAKQILQAHAGELAAVLVDPMPSQLGMIPASSEFLNMLRSFTQQDKSLLIMDEVMSFRLGYHGAQGEFSVKPDLTTLSKAIGGGFPSGAIAGLEEVMSVFDPTRGTRPPLPHAGTFNANPISMVAGHATMSALTPDAFTRLNALGERARAEINRAFKAAGVPGQAVGRGSLMYMHLTDRPLNTYRDAYASIKEKVKFDRLWRYLLNHGIIIGSNKLISISTPMTESNVDQLAESLLAGLRELGREGELEQG